MVMSAEERRLSKISDGQIRLSVGIEDGDDLIADIKQSLLKATGLWTSLPKAPGLNQRIGAEIGATQVQNYYEVPDDLLRRRNGLWTNSYSIVIK